MGVAAAEQGLPWREPLVETAAASSGHRADRRQLFRRWANRAMESGAPATPPPPEIPASAIRAAAPFVPARRRLADYVMERFETVPESHGLARLLGIGALSPGAGHCNGCEVCARVCPTGALKVAEGERRWELQFTPGQCVGCGVCVESCGAGALTLENHWQRAGESPLPLHRLERYRCQACGRFFVGSAAEHCPVCKSDENSFEAIFG